MSSTLTSPEPTTAVISEEQKATLAAALAESLGEGATASVDDLIGRGVINPTNFEKVRARVASIKDAVTELVSEKLAEIADNVMGILRLISGGKKITLKKTDGKRTLAQASDVFKAGLDGDFKNYGTDVAGSPKGETDVEVHEMMKDGDFTRIFGSFDADLEKLCLEQDQIIDFCVDHRDWLRTEGYATFFLFKVVFDKGTKKERTEFFVARVSVYVRELDAYVRRFSDDCVWDGEYRPRIVVPQLAPSAN
jgi:hypothetical protein